MCLGCWEKGHLIAQCPKVRHAKRVLKHLNQGVKEGYQPRGEKKGTAGKPAGTSDSLPPSRRARGTLVPVRQRRRTQKLLARVDMLPATVGQIPVVCPATRPLVKAQLQRE